MKSMFKVLISVLALGVAGFISTASAQEKGKGGKGGGGRGGMTIERLEEAVGSLTAEQKTKIEAIMAKQREALQAIPQEERQEKGREIMTKGRADIRAVLTAEQQAKFDAMPQGGRGGKKQ
jgi:Spy/CpxP family protein refolding chaperone